MKSVLLIVGGIVLGGVSMLGSGALAQQGAARPPAGATAACKDGSFSTEANRDTACAANRGVKEWWGKVDPNARAALPATSGNAPVARTADGKPLVQIPENQVIADAKTKMYQLCASGDEHEAPVASEESASRRPARPPGELMSEEEAKAKGFRAGAHKVNCQN